MKRFRPRAQGRGFPIKKPTCHISITVGAKGTYALRNEIQIESSDENDSEKK